jgi:hypothetical protein
VFSTHAVPNTCEVVQPHAPQENVHFYLWKYFWHLPNFQLFSEAKLKSAPCIPRGPHLLITQVAKITLIHKPMHCLLQELVQGITAVVLTLPHIAALSEITAGAA